MKNKSPNRCACGAKKYSDASSCEKCFREAQAYDSRESNSRFGCGHPQYPDAWYCSVCAEESGYLD